MAIPDLRSRLIGWRSQWRILQMARQVAARSKSTTKDTILVPGSDDKGRSSGAGEHKPPVVFFNASARIFGLSQNAAFSLLTNWGLRLAGAPVQHFVCQAGMSLCVQGTNRQDYHMPPPCKACIRQSRRLYTGSNVRWLEYRPDTQLSSALQNLSVTELSVFEYPLFPLSPLSPGLPSTHNPHPPMPLGRIVLPSIRWALRRHTLPDDEDTRYLMREYILSAYHVAQEFARWIEELKPAMAVIFNGILFPEAAARWAAMQSGLRVVTHEVGFQRYSAFFTDGEATAYPIHIPEAFEMNAEQNARLDAYLENRFHGRFTMAGIRFWPEMHGLDEALLQKIAQFSQLVPVFTNVAYDTSQVHANQVFPSMFAWLDLVLDLIRVHSETLFIIRAHPDEMRPGTAKQSRESVHDWVLQKKVKDLPNAMFIDSQEYISSYELIQRAKFVIVYNSSIGMEATLMGTPVLCGGKARYTQYPIVFFPETIPLFHEMAEQFLAASKIELPPEFQRNARRFLYYQLYRASLSFEDYLEEGPRKGFVQLQPFSWRKLLPENSITIRTLAEGILGSPRNASQPFLVEETS